MTALKTRQIRSYTQAAEEIETQIRKLVEEDRELEEKIDRITKVKGLGLITAVTVLCETKGFRLFNNIQQAVSYAGLDVVLKESGKFKGKTGISFRTSLVVSSLTPTFRFASCGAEIWHSFGICVKSSTQLKVPCLLAVFHSGIGTLVVRASAPFGHPRCGNFIDNIF
ncbi:Transposase IS116/IS110/IS902 family protein [Bacteroidales bacterium Barb6XT]|nr:Transposase IS116/IS110/IS902 family protein [Bacteroidales bacterium Barb6XT]